MAPTTLTADIAPGLVTVLTGPNGVGKSTALQAILGLDRSDVRASTGRRCRRRRSRARGRGGARWPGWRSARCWCPASVRDNLELFGPLPDLDSACRAAGFDEVLDGLPDGLQTAIGRGGVGLSLGQRQRLGLARVLGSAAPVLLLDEPTAHLDAAMEARVLRPSSRGRAAGATVVVVGHREPVLAIGDGWCTSRAARAVLSARDPLLAAIGLLRPRLPRLLLAIALGVLSLGSALALAGVSAWLITRAWQMPPVLDLTVAVVAVRALGISRGVFGYCERLASHDTALRAAGNARARLYSRLANGPADAAMRLHSGELVARVGASVDELVRCAGAGGVADLRSPPCWRLAAVAVIAVISPAAARRAGRLPADRRRGWRRGWRPGPPPQPKPLPRSIIPAATPRRCSPSSTRRSCGSAAGSTRSSPNPNDNTAIGDAPPTGPQRPPLWPRGADRRDRGQRAGRRRRRNLARINRRADHASRS